MKDIIINVKNRTRAVSLNSDILGVVGENLQGRFIIDFKNEFIDGVCFLLCDMPNGESGYISMTKDATNKIYSAPIKSSMLTVAGNIQLQVKITENSVDDEIPIFKSKVFDMTVESAVNAQTVLPEDYPDWEDVANAKLAEIDQAIEDMKTDALPDVTDEDDGKILEVNEQGEWVVSGALNEIRNTLSDLTYKAIDITSFTNNKNTVEIGSTVTSVNLSWAFSKTPKTVTLDGVSKSVSSTGESITGLTLKTNKTWKLEAIDERNHKATKTTSISFLNGVYYGVASKPATYDSSFVLGLTKTLRSSKLTSFNVTAGTGQYIYYCLPKRMGTCTFTIGGFNGGLALVSTITFVNSSGYAEEYYIYKSDQANLGYSQVTVS